MKHYYMSIANIEGNIKYSYVNGVLVNFTNNLKNCEDWFAVKIAMSIPSQSYDLNGLTRVLYPLEITISDEESGCTENATSNQMEELESHIVRTGIDRSMVKNVIYSLTNRRTEEARSMNKDEMNLLIGQLSTLSDKPKIKHHQKTA